MTAVVGESGGAQPLLAVSLGPARLLRGIDTAAGPLSHAEHERWHGPQPSLSMPELIEACTAVALAGRGGAAFPVATKLAALRPGRRVRVVVNGSESEPASRKDRLLLTRSPHLVLDGARLVAEAAGARTVDVSVHDPAAERAVRAAADERRDHVDVSVSRIDGGFVAGEARSVLRALDGGPPLPPGRRVLPTERGLGGAPTFVANVETMAQLAVLARSGVAGFRSVGSPTEPGTTLLTVGGSVTRPGVYEVPLGIGLAEVLAAAGAVRPAALAIGGYHGSWLPVRPDLAVTRAAIGSAGGTLGAGVLLVLSDATCALGELIRVAGWLARESAGQCGPCRFGLPALVADLVLLYKGDPRGAAAARRHAGLVTGRGACAHPDGAARFVTSALALLGPELAAHRHPAGCGRPVRGELPLGPARPT